MTDPQQKDFEFAVTVAQIFSGVTFTLVAIWMTFTNSASLAYLQRASLEKRLTTCCFINTYVGMFSAFFNFFQLTQVDDLIVPEQNNYTIDLARPIEWIATCPLMQLVLVILGGSKVPEIRRALMPALSVIVLCFGLASTYFRGTVRFIPYAAGLITAFFMFFLNAKQIQEHSDNLESFLSGDSEYRKASLLVILLWFPFPAWYILSPEGLGWIDDVLLVQVGWAFLNIVSKFSFIFYIQRMKDNYCTKLKAKRESYQPRGKKNEMSGELTAVILETLGFLGMAQHSDRILNLFPKAGVLTSKDVSSLSQQECKDKLLPWDVVRAVQQRLLVWRLETQDNAELDIAEGEGHYFKGKKYNVVDDDNASTTSSFVLDDNQQYSDTPESEDHPYAIVAVDSDNRPRSAQSRNSKHSKHSKQSRQLVNGGYLGEQLGAVGTKLQQLTTKLDSLQSSSARRAVEEEHGLLGKIESIVDNASHRNERCMVDVGKMLSSDMRILSENTATIHEQVTSSNNQQEAAMADMRRQHMMLMELVSTDRDSINDKITDLNRNLNGMVMTSSDVQDNVRYQAAQQTSAQQSNYWN